MTCFHFGYRQVTVSSHKHRIAHALYSVNLQSACSRMMNVWRYSNGREQELKAQYIIICPISSCQNGNAELMILRIPPHVYFLLWESSLWLKRPDAFLFSLMSVSYCHVLVKPCILSMSPIAG